MKNFKRNIYKLSNKGCDLEISSIVTTDPTNVEAAKTLLNIYSVTGDTVKSKAMKAKIDSFGGN